MVLWTYGFTSSLAGSKLDSLAEHLHSVRLFKTVKLFTQPFDSSLSKDNQ